MTARRADDAILVLNAGSSSIKLALFVARGGGLALELRGAVDGLYTAPRFTAQDPAGHVVAEASWDRAALDHDGAVEYLSDFVAERLGEHRLVGVGHRVVHGGRAFMAPVRVETETLTALEGLIPLAPLHQPHNLSPIASLLKRSPDVPQVACFDTSFHRTNPEVARRFALPASSTTPVFSGTGSTASPTSTSPPSCRTSMRPRRRADDRDASGQRREPVRDGCRPRRGDTMGFTTWTGCRWARAAARSIRA